MRLRRSLPKTLPQMIRTFPDWAIEEVSDRRELVIYTGLSIATYNVETDEWTETPGGRLVPMNEDLY